MKSREFYTNKIGFLTTLALVINSQIGSGIFMLPNSLAPYGIYSLVGWIISGAGAISLALVFAMLCAKFPETGGPYIYVKHTFGSTVAFFVGWTYWVSSWVSTTALIVIGISYLTPFFHENIQNTRLLLELLLLVIITLTSLRGIAITGRIEFLFTIIKITVLLIISVTALFFFDKNNFIISEEISNLTVSQVLARSVLLTMWCFIGLESVTVPAGLIDNSKRIIPKAIVLGTICVVVIYFINNFAIMGLISGNALVNSRAPYVDAVKIMFSGDWHLIISIFASIFCISSLNAWILFNGQIAVGLAEDKFIPQFFAKKNRYDSPFLGIIVSSIGTAILLIFTSSKNFVQQITLIIDFSVVSFLFIYLICSFAFLKIIRKEGNCYRFLISGIAIIFCCWIIFEIPVSTLLTTSLFTISGIPFYLFYIISKHLFKVS